MAREAAFLTAELLRGWEVIVMVGCQTDNLWNCSSNVFNALSWHSAKVWNPSIRPRSKPSCLPMGALWEEMALRNWSESAGSVRVDTDADSVEVTNFYY